MRNPNTTAIIVLLFVTGCAHQEKYMHSQSSVFVKPQLAAATVTVADDLTITIDCLQNESRPPVRWPGWKAKQCLYAAADLASLQVGKSLTQKQRNEVVNLLMNISDANCSNYLYRVFANKAGLETSRNFLKDLTTGLAAGTVTSAPGVSVGLGFTSLLTASTVDNINATYYVDKSFQAMEAAIIEERMKVKVRILRSLTGHGEYGLSAALMDIRALDDSCSIQRGLSRLLELASTEKKKAENALNSVGQESLDQKVEP